MLEATLATVAQALGVPPNRVQWQDDVPAGIGWGLVVHTPWARVLVGRTESQALRFAEQYKEMRRGGLWLLEALGDRQAGYPHVVVDWTDARGLAETPLPNPDLRGFITWSIPKMDRIAWPVTPTVRVLGAWATYPDAVLLVRRDVRGMWEYQLRLAAWKDYTPGG